MSVVLALIIVVAAFTVIATLIMVVLDKKKEIARPQGDGRDRRAPSCASSSIRAGSSACVGTTLGLLHRTRSCARGCSSTVSRSTRRSISSRGFP